MLVVGFLGCTWYEGGSGQTNHKPLTPTLSGPDTTHIGVQECYEVTVGDPDGNRLRVFTAWGDGDTTEYGAFVGSGATALFEHAFLRPGVFGVRARCHDDVYPDEPLFSDWSTPHDVVVLE